MFEVFVNGISLYCGNNWVHALSPYFKGVQRGDHVILWEGEEPVREYHPTMGHYANDMPPKDDINAPAA